MLTTAARNGLALLIFNATTWLDIAEDKVTSPATALFVSLHDTFPGAAGDQTTGETAYTNYARQSVARTSGGWTVSGNNVSNTALVGFPQCGATGSTPMFFGVGTDLSGTGNLLGWGVLGSVIGAAEVNDPSTEDVQSQNHGLVADDRVVFVAGPGNTIPAGLTEGTVYHVISGGLTTDAFRVSTTQGGSAVNITGDGDAIAYKVVPLAISNGITPEFAIGVLDVNFF